MVQAKSPEIGTSAQGTRINRDFMTLTRHVLAAAGGFTPEAYDLSALMGRIALAGKMISRALHRAGLVEGVLGLTGEVNVQGESVKKMDAQADRVFIRAFEQSGLVCRLVSEEMEKPYYIPENCPIGRYTLLYDPIDGSGNIDVNLAVGSIFAVRQQEGSDDGEARDLYQPARGRQRAAGYILYGSSTVLVYTLGQGVHAFTLDPELGEFILSQENVRLPERGQTYSVNEANFGQWPPAVQQYVQHIRQQGYASRYSGALVADFHRILFQGGIYLYPGTAAKPEGKLRMLYEAAPLAEIAEQAGGSATNGVQPILDVASDRLHARTPLIIGSREEVALFQQLQPSSSFRA